MVNEMEEISKAHGLGKKPGNIWLIHHQIHRPKAVALAAPMQTDIPP